MVGKNRAIIIALAIAALTAAALSAAGETPKPAAADVLKPATELCAPYYAEMIAAGKALRTSDGPSPRLLPAGPAAERIREAIVADKPGILVESAFFLPRPAPAERRGREAELAAIYGLLRSFSTLEGIQYYSATHKAMRVLFAESYRIDGPGTKLRLSDQPAPAIADIPRSEALFAFQRDLNFGSNIYSYSFESAPGCVTVTINNLTRLSFGIIPLVAPKALEMRLLALQASDGIVFYVESDSSSPGPFRGKLEESFSNRATALFAWFSSRSASFLQARP
jgi:hypothetical protein